MSLSIGIVGLPNVGKSTLFNALVKNAQAAASNYPFCTIEPNVGIVPVPDPRLEKLASIVTTEQIIPATVEFVDIAGIIRGASKGEGLGNQFLATIRECSALIMLSRFFEGDVIHVSGKVDPVDDLETVQLELALADLQTVEKALDRYRRAARGAGVEAAELVTVTETLYATLEKGIPVRTLNLTSDAAKIVLRELQLLTAKPIIIVANVAEDSITTSAESLFVEYRLDRFVSSSDFVLPLCAQVEAELAQVEGADQLDLLGAYGMQEPGLNRLIRGAYALLGLQTYFTCGPKEIRAWTIQRGLNAQLAAGVIHTDFIKHFIRAETIAYNDYVSLGGEQGAKEGGKLRLEGKEYIVQDGDVLHFRVSV